MKISTIIYKAKPYMASVGLRGHGGQPKVNNDPNHFWNKLYPKFHEQFEHRLKYESFHDYLQS